MVVVSRRLSTVKIPDDVSELCAIVDSLPTKVVRYIRLWRCSGPQSDPVWLTCLLTTLPLTVMSPPSWPSLDPHLEALVVSMDTQFAALGSPVTRAKLECWRSQSLVRLNLAQPPTYPLVSEWLSEALDLEISFLDPEEAMRGFVEIHLLQWSQPEEELNQFLRALQARVLDAMVCELLFFLSMLGHSFGKVY